MGAALVGEPEDLSYDAVAEAPPIGTIPAMLEWTLRELRANGFTQAIVVDLTQRSIGIPVVHVSVPGLEGALGKPGYTPGPRMQQLFAERIEA